MAGSGVAEEHTRFTLRGKLVNMQTETGKKPGTSAMFWVPLVATPGEQIWKLATQAPIAEVNETVEAVFEGPRSVGKVQRGTVSEPERTSEQVNKQKKRGREV
ncbi:hypothetical protein KQX54_016658 [Cotesia glomerata]|uniref:Uncharacterized protein n=1 Tax=Cotesia glomerata TaxID=32391 RepID=A0AAV7I3D3_COTGL|nr:hypothetical protein KQX54_016658 [Cotesia glomerata]